MFHENLFLAGIVIALGILLYTRIGKEENVKKKPKLPPKIKLISEKTGEIIEMKIVEKQQNTPDKGEFDEKTFIKSAKMAFQLITNGFASGDLTLLKSMTTTSLFNHFEQIIKQRKEQENTLDFSLVCFEDVKIIEKTPNEISVKFITEQINILKDKAGTVIEGDALSIAKICDCWKFQKKGKSKWILVATKSGEINA